MNLYKRLEISLIIFKLKTTTFDKIVDVVIVKERDKGVE